LFDSTDSHGVITVFRILDYPIGSGQMLLDRHQLGKSVISIRNVERLSRNIVFHSPDTVSEFVEGIRELSKDAAVGPRICYIHDLLGRVVAYNIAA
jgi:hypothetical protein